MDHPNLLRVWPLGEENGRLLAAVERCAHPSLTDLLRSGPVQPGVCARILAGAAAGADALSRRGLVARDLTPDAVFGHPEYGGLLADLGIPPELLRAPLEPDMGLLFRSPEELRDQRLDPRSTVYSLGLLLFTALTRAHPYEGPWSHVHVTLRAGGAPRRSQGWSELPPGMDQVVARALAPDPEQRYTDAEALAHVAAATLGTDFGSKSPPVDSSSEKPQRRTSPKAASARSQPKARATTPSPKEDGSTQARPLQRARHRSSGSPHGAPGERSAKVQSRPPPARKNPGIVRPEAPTQSRPRPQWAEPGPKPRWLNAPQTGLSRRPTRPRRPKAGSRPAMRHHRSLLVAVGALVLGALTGVALGRAVDVDRQPSSVTHAGLTVQLPAGWERVQLDRPGRAPFRGIAVGPPEKRGSGLVAGKLSSQAAAERILAGAQAKEGQRTPVRLGELEAWRYTGLEPRAGLVGTGYVIPTTGGAMVVICHTPKDAGAFLVDCGRAASTLVASGERALRVSSVDRSRERLFQAIATLRSRRAEGLQRLAAADRASGQFRAAASLERTHRRAAQPIDRIPPLADGHSLGQLSAAMRAVADGYGRLAAAARTRRTSTYREARRTVVREERALRRELAEVSGA
jgi:serine/threonine protein kinase